MFDGSARVLNCWMADTQHALLLTMDIPTLSGNMNYELRVSISLLAEIFASSSKSFSEEAREH